MPESVVQGHSHNVSDSDGNYSAFASDVPLTRKRAAERVGASNAPTNLNSLEARLFGVEESEGESVVGEKAAGENVPPSRKGHPKEPEIQRKRKKRLTRISCGAAFLNSSTT